jgi:hypothetical protein
MDTAKMQSILGGGATGIMELCRAGATKLSLCTGYLIKGQETKIPLGPEPFVQLEKLSCRCPEYAQMLAMIMENIPRVEIVLKKAQTNLPWFINNEKTMDVRIATPKEDLVHIRIGYLKEAIEKLGGFGLRPSLQREPTPLAMRRVPPTTIGGQRQLPFKKLNY